MWSLTDASPERLQEIAYQIEDAGRWTSFLTPQEHQFFESALKHNVKTWSLFIRGKIPCQLRLIGNEEGSTQATEVDPVTLAFRVRYMLWDALIDATGSGDSSSASGTKTEAKSGAIEEGNKPTKDKSDDDDDYDDDDDDADKEASAGSSSDDIPLEVITVEAKQEDSEPDSRGRLAAVISSSKMYDTFEFDQEKMKRFQRLKDSDEQIQRDDDGDPSLSSEYNIYGTVDGNDAKNNLQGSTSSLVAFAKTAQFGSANLCLKHLLTTIEAKRSELQVTDIEIRNLISDVRKNRSKWASEERIGQEELYEACERVVQELRGTTEHSTAFLNKVSKREAPNYYDIIKHPMDLNTVMRKLRALQYNSKEEFVNDLNLIWSNCLTYNSDPSHFLRAHATAMRKKTQALAPLIPDVTIRPRAEVEAEAESLEQQSRDNRKRRSSEPEEEVLGSKRKIGVTPAKFNAQDETGGDQTNKVDSLRNTEEPSGEKTEDPSREIESAQPEEVKEEDPLKKQDQGRPVEGDAPDQTGNNGNASSAEEATDAENEGLQSSIEPIDEEEYQVPDVESAFWNSATRRKRIQCIVGRNALFTDDKLQMDVPVSVRSPRSMSRFDKTIRGEDIANQMSGMSLLSTDSGEEPFMVEYEIHAGVPESLANDNSPWVKAPVPKLQDLPPSKYLSRGIMTDLVNRNLNEMQVIRRLCAKILYIRDLQSGQLAPQYDQGISALGTAGSSSEYPKIKDPEEDISSRLPGAVSLDGRASHSAMKRTVAKLAMQAGFEAAQPRAIDSLTEIAGEYLTKLGETLVANLEAPNSTASFGSVISGSLEQMGVSRMSLLTKYISDDILRQGRRLSTFQSRLNSMLVDILRPEVEKYQDEQFQDNSEQFVLGQFSNDLGDDYFGFKELGINEELGMSSIAVPFHLLQQRVAYQDSGIPQRGMRRKLGLDVPEYPALTPNDIANMPPLLKPVFTKILIKFNTPDQPTSQADTGAATSGQSTPEDERGEKKDPNIEFIAQIAAQAAHARAKVPTSGKLAPRKKNFDRAFILVKDEPEPEPEPEPAPESKLEDDHADEQPNSENVSPLNQDRQDVNGIGEPGQTFSDPDVDAELNQEIGSLAFEQESTASTNGFMFDDSLPTGSLLLQPDDIDDDDGNATGEDLGFDFMKK